MPSLRTPRLVLIVLASLAARGATAQQQLPFGERPSREAVLAEMLQDELVHRERLAVIARLATLAEASGDARRLALLDKLEVKEFARFHRQTERRRGQLDYKTFQHASMALGKGRMRAADAQKLQQMADRKQSEEKLEARREKREQAGLPANAARDRGKKAADDGAAGDGPDAPRDGRR